MVQAVGKIGLRERDAAVLLLPCPIVGARPAYPFPMTGTSHGR